MKNIEEIFSDHPNKLNDLQLTDIVDQIYQKGGRRTSIENGLSNFFQINGSKI